MVMDMGIVPSMDWFRIGTGNNVNSTIDWGTGGIGRSFYIEIKLTKNN
jgi:hypothetical protein